MNIRDQMAAVDVNLDDLQSAIEAASRAADALKSETTTSNASLNATWLRSVVRHVEDLRECARDQQELMQELRDGLLRVRKELKCSDHSVVRSPTTVVRGEHETAG